MGRHYSLGRDTAQAHLAALDIVYDGFIASHREAIAATGDPDPVTQDIFISQTAELEKFQWFVRAHLESAAGSLPEGNSHTERGAAATVR